MLYNVRISWKYTWIIFQMNCAILGGDLTPTSYNTKLRPFKVSASKYIYTHVRAHTHKDVKSWFQLTIPGAKKEKETEKRSSLPESHVVRRCSLYPSYKLNQVRRSARTSCSPKKKKTHAAGEEAWRWGEKEEEQGGGDEEGDEDTTEKGEGKEGHKDMRKGDTKEKQ